MTYATLGGVPGAGEAISRPREVAQREYRGTFFFRSEDERTVSELSSSRALVEFDGPVDGERKRLSVILTSVLLGSGMAFFNGSGEPY